MDGSIALNPQDETRNLNDVISNVLKYGVMISSVVVAAGLLLTVTSPPASIPESLQSMLQGGFGRPTLNTSVLLIGVAAGNSVSLLELGTLLLLATPLARVAASVFLFMRERDTLYVCVTLLVLVMLLVAVFVIGPSEA